MRGKNLINYYLIGISIALVLLHLYILTKNHALKYEVANMKIKLKELRSANRIMASKLSAQEALPAIEKKAALMGMAYPEKINYILITQEAK